VRTQLKCGRPGLDCLVSSVVAASSLELVSKPSRNPHARATCSPVTAAIVLTRLDKIQLGLVGNESRVALQSRLKFRVLRNVPRGRRRPAGAAAVRAQPAAGERGREPLRRHRRGEDGDASRGSGGCACGAGNGGWCENCHDALFGKRPLCGFEKSDECVMSKAVRESPTTGPYRSSLLGVGGARQRRRA